MSRLDTFLSVFFATLLAAPAALAQVPAGEGLRHTSGELARNAVTPEVTDLLSPPSQVAASRAYEAGSLWLDEGVAAERTTALLAANAAAAAAAATAKSQLGAPSAVDQALAAVAAEIQYPTGKARVRHRWHPQLDALAVILRENSQLRVEVIGHTDDAGDDEFNQWLAARRAERLRKHLAARGINEQRIATTGVGATRPLGDNDTDEGRARNRRVEIRVIE